MSIAVSRGRAQQTPRRSTGGLASTIRNALGSTLRPKKRKTSSDILANQAEVTVPAWYKARPGRQLAEALSSGKPVFLYVPWIPEHGDALVGKLASEDYLIAPLDFVRDTDQPGRRKAVIDFAWAHAGSYRRMILRRLLELKGRVEGVILTFDWAPAMRIIAMVCRDLGIPTILIPHESVFMDRDKYYRDPKTSASVPSTDVVLGWGAMQKEIFCERGYPEERFIAVGAPKFDIYHSRERRLTRDEFCNCLGFNPHRKIVLFATQNLDSQIDQTLAREAQRQAILDLAELLPAHDAQLIVRLPPSRTDVLGKELRSQLVSRSGIFIDEATCYVLPPEETLLQSDLVTSINSTMLLEAVLARVPALSLKYIEFVQEWAKARIPAATSRAELERLLPGMLSGHHVPDRQGLAWAAEHFSSGAFDGRASDRIRTFLSGVARGERRISMRGSAVERLLAGENMDIVAIPSTETTFATTQRHLKETLGVRTLLSTSQFTEMDPRAFASADLFLQWGLRPSKSKSHQAALARELGRPLVIVEDGFLRSVRIGLSGDPGLSVILDPRTAYYDAGNVSWLADMLQNGPELTEAEERRASAAMASIRENRLSKYNDAPCYQLTIGERSHKVLLVDQRHGDQSVAAGMADEDSFRRMVRAALADHPQSDIIVKLHPDAISGGMGSYLTPDMFPANDRIHLVDYDVNTWSLLDIVDDIYVVTSGMGFEALMAGKRVHCYGMPFYAGWGVTEDILWLPTRTRKRSVTDIFHFAYIKASRYYSPDLGRRCEIEDLIRYLVNATEDIRSIE